MLRLELVNITKRYPGVTANDGISLGVSPGRIHAVLGENGAGKSTLMKIIYGAVQPDAGSIAWNGRAVRLENPRKARALGISMVFQHFSLFETLSVAENVWLGLDRSLTLEGVTARIREVAKDYGLELEPGRPVHTLSVGERQRVELVRALLGEPKLLILDEPTSVLTPQAVEKLFVTLRAVAQNGCSILYISHKLDEIRALCHHCTVLRAGRVTGEVDPSTLSSRELSELMIGAAPPLLEHRAARAGELALAISSLDAPAPDEFGTSLRQVSLELSAGEIVGIAGVSGNGQNELLAALSGEAPATAGGVVKLFGADITRAPPAKRRALGLHFVPEERLGRATVPDLSLAENTLLTRAEPVTRAGFVKRGTLKQLAERVIQRFHVKARGPAAPARSLSGGNLQKFVIGREIDARPRVLIVSQPTWGVDVGAAAQIRGELLQLRDAGSAVLVVSEELEELFELCDALAVMAGGRLSPRVPVREASTALIGEWMSGLWPGNAAEPGAGTADVEARTTS